MNEHLSQRELESYLWGAATLLRGLVDASDYKQYIFPLMFFKRLSDVWDEDYQEALDDTGDEGYATATANDRFVIPEGAHWNDVRAIHVRPFGHFRNLRSRRFIIRRHDVLLDHLAARMRHALAPITVRRHQE